MIFRHFAQPIVCGLALLVAAPALADVFAAQPPLGRYDARTIVTGIDGRSRPTGLAICLEDVLVKVSGDRTLRGDKRLAALDPNPLVIGYSYVDRLSGLSHHDEQGSSDRPFYLTARFDRVRVDAQLLALGDVAFDGRRPTVAPLVFVSHGSVAYLLTADGPHAAGQREAMAEAGDRLGVPVHLPTTTELVDGRSLAGLLPLTGTLAWSDTAHGWVGDWSMANGGASHAWRSAGGSYDQAFRAAIGGALGIVAGHLP